MAAGVSAQMTSILRSFIARPNCFRSVSTDRRRPCTSRSFSCANVAAKIRISRPDDAQGLLAQPLGQDVIALATPPRDEAVGPIALVASEQSLHLTHTQHELRSGLFLRKPTLSDRTHPMRPFVQVYSRVSQNIYYVNFLREWF